MGGDGINRVMELVLLIALSGVAGVLVSRLYAAGFTRYTFRSIFSILLLKIERFIIIILTLTIVWITVFGALIHLISGLSLIDSFKWVIVEMFGVQIPGLPPVRSGLAHALLALSGLFGPLILAMMVGFLVDVAIRISGEYHMGLSTDAKSLGFQDHLVVFGWNEMVKRSIVEILRAQAFGVYKTEIRDIIVVVPLSMDPNVVRHEINEIKQNIGDRGFIPGSRIDLVRGTITDERTLDRAYICEASAMIVSMGSDEDTLNILLSIINYFKDKNCFNDKKEKIIVVEALEDENEALFNAIKTHLSTNRQEKITWRIRVVLSRSYAGKLLASAISEPLSVRTIIDLISFRQGRLDLVKGEWKKLKDSMGQDIDKIEPILELGDDGSWHIVEDEEPRGIVIAARRYASQFEEPYIFQKGSESVKMLSILRTPEVGGHITVIGFTEATESMIKELKRKRSAQRLSEEQYALRRSMILVSSKDITDILWELTPASHTLLDTIVHIKGEPMRPEVLRRAGLLSSSAIIISMNSDEKTLKVALQTSYLVKKAIEELGGNLRRPLILVETKDRDVQEKLLNVEVADFAIASRHLAAQLAAYAILDPDVFEIIQDLISSTEGRLDTRQLTYTVREEDTPPITIRDIIKRLRENGLIQGKIHVLSAMWTNKNKPEYSVLPGLDSELKGIKPGETIDIVVITHRPSQTSK